MKNPTLKGGKKNNHKAFMLRPDDDGEPCNASHEFGGAV